MNDTICHNVCLLHFMPQESIDEEEDEVWCHGHDGEIRGPELLFVALDCLIENIPELELPVAVNVIEEIPRQKHSNTQPAAYYEDKVVLVLERVSLFSRHDGDHNDSRLN